MNGKGFKYKPGTDLPFTAIEEEERARTYLTEFGPIWTNPESAVYKNNIHNLSLALGRIDNKRDNEEDLQEMNFKIAPNGNRRLSRYLNSYYDLIKTLVTKSCCGLGDDLLEQITNACNKAHPKYKLRVRCIRELVDRANMYNDLFTENKYGDAEIIGKVKIPEFAKLGKKPRLIGDFGCPGSLLAAFLVPLLKNAFAEGVQFDDVEIKFVNSTAKEAIDTAITELVNATKNTFVYFSDDMVAKIFNEDGTSELYNLDISSCDASNGPAVFDRLQWLFDENTGTDSLMERAIRQCRQPLLLRRPGEVARTVSRKEKITAKGTTALEYSGTQLTTLLNNIASCAICLSIHYGSKRRREGEDTVTLVHRCAFAVGYKVTAEFCENTEELQFLKHSFTQTADGVCHSWFNLGPFFRSSGTCYMDLPFNRKLGESFEGAARMRNWMMLESFKNAGDNFILRHLRTQPAYQRINGEYVVLENKFQTEYQYRFQDNSKARLPVSYHAMQRRYGFSEDEVLGFLGRDLEILSEHSDPMVMRILEKDYGYSLRGE